VPKSLPKLEYALKNYPFGLTKDVTVSKRLNFRRSSVSPRRYDICVCHLKLSRGTSSRSLEKLLSVETDL